jgi:hypothetical protein
VASLRSWRGKRRHALIEEFLDGDPEFARILRVRGDESLLGHDVPSLPLDSEAKAIRKTKRLLHGWDWLLFMAMIFSGFAFGRIVSDTSWDVSPVNFIIVASIALAFWISFFTRLVLVRKRFYSGRPGRHWPMRSLAGPFVTWFSKEHLPPSSVPGRKRGRSSF